jgi:transcriptional regulator with XRE-family HTH domain
MIVNGKFRLKELAQVRGFTQEELSVRSGVKLSTLRRIWQNKGVENPRSDHLLAIARTLELSVEDLYNPTFREGARLPDNRMSLAGVAA